MKKEAGREPGTLKKIAAIRIERKKLEDLNPAEYNPRKRLMPGDDEYEKLRRSIETFTYVDPIIVNKDGTVIGGHQRLFVLRDMGYTEADVSVVDLSKNDEKALNIALNKISGEWDEEKLAEIFADLDAEGFDLSLTGFEDDELSKLLVGEESDFVDMDKADENVPEPTEHPVTRLGDVWRIGKHRLICGDSTDATTFDRLLCGEKARLVVTDPPYNVAYEGVAGKILNDNMSSNSFRAFLAAMYSAVASVTEAGAAAYIFHADSEGVAFREEFERAGFSLKQCLIWVKNAFVLGRQDYQWRHEPILYGWRDGASHYFTDKRNLSTVIDESGKPNPENMSREDLEELVSLLYDAVADEPTSIIYCDKPLRNAEHPTMKPTRLIARLIENSSKSGWIVLDPFGGSGSTLIAAEATGRQARLAELDPKFCDVTVKRYVAVTGKKDITLVRNGKEIQVDDTTILS